MRNSILFAIFVSVFISVHCRLSAQDNPIEGESRKPDQRKIFVPFESLDILLDGNSNRVLLTRSQYDELVDSARTREIKRAPLDSAIVSAKYTGEVSEGVALIQAELIVEPLNEGLIQIPLPFSGVAMRSASLGGQPAMLWRNENGEIVLLTSSKSRETLKLEMTVPMQTSAARQSMSIRLPSPAATTFGLKVPGNVEVKSGIPVANREYDETSDTTSFDLLAENKPMNIVMSLNNRLLKDEQVAVSRSVMIHKLTPHAQEMHVTCSMDVIHGALEEVEFSVPEGFQVSQVATELLSQWEIRELPLSADGSGSRLVVRLRQPTREDFVLNITATRGVGAVGDWVAEDIRPVDVAGHVSVVGVLADIDLKSAKLVSDGVIPIDYEFLLAAIPESLRSANHENPTVVMAAFYAPQQDYSIAASFSVPAAELTVKSNSRLVIDNQKLELQGGVSLVSKHDSRFGFRLILPNMWRIDELTGADGRSIQFDRVGEDGASEFLVHLPARIPSTSSAKVFFRASLTPEGWLERWESNLVDFPSVKIKGETKHSGAIAISPRDDLSVKPANVTNLELLDETDKKKFELDRNNAPLAYQFDNSNFQLKLELERLKPSIMARTYNYVTVKPTQLLVHAELILDVKQARQGSFKFDLPLESPKSISIRTTEGQLKDYQSEEMEGARRWSVQLAKPKRGKVHLLVDYQMPLEEAELAELKLRPVIVRDVEFQSSMFAIEGSSELDIEIETEGRAVDVGEFSQAVYQPGRHLLGTYSWPNENMSIIVRSVRRPVYQLPSAIVQRAEMLTSISNNGKVQTAARFHLVTKQQPFLRIELPNNATLWSIQLDGQPAKPQLQDGALLVSLMGNEAGKLRDLQLVFESPGKSFRFVGKIEALAPTLWLNAPGDSEGVVVPLVDLHWRLVMPDGFSVSHSDGQFQSNQLVNRPTPVRQLADWVYRLGGGIGELDFGILAVRTAALSTMSSDQAFSPSGSADADARIPTDSIQGQFSDWDDEEMDEGGVDEEKKRFDTPRQSRQNQPQTGRPAIAAPSGQTATDREGEPSETMNAVEPPPASQKQLRNWALSGLRSLNIELTDTGNAIDFYSLGEQPKLTATVVNHSRLNWIAIALALSIAALGVLFTRRQIKSKIILVMLLLVIACLVPLVGTAMDAFRTIIDLAILTAIFLAIYFVFAGIVNALGRSITIVAARIPLFFLLFSITVGCLQQAYGQQVINDAADLKRLIKELQTDSTVELPNDAIIIPYDLDDPRGRENADRLLLPYEHYLKLMNKAELGTEPESIDSPVDFVLSSAEYSLQLTLDADISIFGKLVIEQLTDEPVLIALPLMGGALADAKVDGSPAKLQFRSTLERKNSPEKNANSNASVVQLHLEGRGRKTFEFTVRIKPIRQGGWRILNARLPVGMTRGLNLVSLREPAEVRLNSKSDNRSIEAKPNEKIATVLSPDGSLRLQWKPSTATTSVDQSLTANSEAILDVREDGIRLSWRVELDFRGSERDLFTLDLPEEYLVERVSGENVRAWDVKQESDSTRLNVSTLSPSRDSETFTIDLSRRGFSVSETPVQFDAPYLNVEGSALHKGVYTVRRSPLIELKTTKQQAASRIDENQVQRRIDIGEIDSKSSPLGIESFQVYRFVTAPFQLGLQANLIPRKIKSETQSVLRIGQTEADLEMRINITVGQRPIYKMSFDIPQEVEIRSLAAGLNESWTSELVDGIQRIHFFFPTGVAEDFAVILDAELTDYSSATQWSIPQVKINDVTEQNGFIAIQVDPSLAVTTNNLKDCETVLLQQVDSWLNRNQRSSTRVVLKTRGSEYAAMLGFTKIRPRVRVETVTNVRTTMFAIEETILLDFDIQQAGIRQIQFELPVSMRNARINAKLVSESIIEDAADNDELIRVTLNLQDEVIDSYRVVIENDKQLSDSPQNVPIPRVLTGVTEQRYATLQNAGRDEINVLPATEFQSLNRQLNQFTRLKQKLAGGEVTMAYVARPNFESPVLRYETRQREVFDTVAASIEFSKTIMVVDSSGAYRALQNFQVNNRSEQYLEIELPTGVRLLTVLVEGQPVKPVSWAAAQNERRLRIPLVKTQLGDLDYPVQLKYAGTLGELSNFTEVEFPVIETLNINVQLSQLHLRLPETHRWMNFGGTMTKVDDRGKLEASYLSYKSRQIQQLAEQIQSKSSQFGAFSKSRAYSNLKQLQRDMVEFETANPRLQKEADEQILDLVQGNNDAIIRAQELYSLQNAQSGELMIDNRANFNGLIERQSARIGRNLINKAEQNFALNIPQSDLNVVESPGKKPAKGFSKGGQQKFDSNWLARNQLGGAKREAGESGGQGPPVDGKPALEQFKAPIVVEQEAQVSDSISFYNPLAASAQHQLGQRTSDSLDNLEDAQLANQSQTAEGNRGQAVEGRFGGGGFGGGGGESIDSSGNAPANRRQESSSESRSDVQIADLGLMQQAGNNPLVGGQASDGVLGSALSSLDIELPARGVDYYFKSPRGKATVVVRPIQARSFSRWASVLVTIGGCIAIWLISWIMIRLCSYPTIRALGTVALLLGGMTSLGLSILPIYGLLAVLASIAMFVDWSTRLIDRREVEVTQ